MLVSDQVNSVDRGKTADPYSVGRAVCYQGVHSRNSSSVCIIHSLCKSSILKFSFPTQWFLQSVLQFYWHGTPETLGRGENWPWTASIYRCYFSILGIPHGLAKFSNGSLILSSSAVTDTCFLSD